MQLITLHFPCSAQYLFIAHPGSVLPAVFRDNQRHRPRPEAGSQRKGNSQLRILSWFSYEWVGFWRALLRSLGSLSPKDPVQAALKSPLFIDESQTSDTRPLCPCAFFHPVTPWPRANWPTLTGLFLTHPMLPFLLYLCFSQNIYYVYFVSALCKLASKASFFACFTLWYIPSTINSVGYILVTQ